MFILLFLSALADGSPAAAFVLYSAPVVTGVLLAVSLMLYRFAKRERREDPGHVSAGRVKGLRTFMIVSAILFGLATLAVAVFVTFRYHERGITMFTLLCLSALADRAR